MANNHTNAASVAELELLRAENIHLQNQIGFMLAVNDHTEAQARHHACANYIVLLTGNDKELAPSIADIAKRAEVSVGTMRNTLGDLQRWGLLTSVRKKGFGGNVAIAHYAISDEGNARMRALRDEIREGLIKKGYLPNRSFSAGQGLTVADAINGADLPSGGEVSDLMYCYRVKSAFENHEADVLAGQYNSDLMYWQGNTSAPEFEVEKSGAYKERARAHSIGSGTGLSEEDEQRAGAQNLGSGCDTPSARPSSTQNQKSDPLKKMAAQCAATGGAVHLPARASVRVPLVGDDLFGGQVVDINPASIEPLAIAFGLTEATPNRPAKVVFIQSELEKCAAQWQAMEINARGRRVRDGKEVRYATPSDWFKFSWRDGVIKGLSEIDKGIDAARGKPDDKVAWLGNAYVTKADVFAIADDCAGFLTDAEVIEQIRLAADGKITNINGPVSNIQGVRNIALNLASKRKAEHHAKVVETAAFARIEASEDFEAWRGLVPDNAETFRRDVIAKVRDFEREVERYTKSLNTSGIPPHPFGSAIERAQWVEANRGQIRTACIEAGITDHDDMWALAFCGPAIWTEFHLTVRALALGCAMVQAFGYRHSMKFQSLARELVEIHIGDAPWRNIEPDGPAAIAVARRGL